MKYKNKIIISAILFFVIDVVVVVFLIIPTFRKINAGAAECLVYKQEFAEIRAEISNFKDFEKNYYLYLRRLEEMKDLISGQVFVDRALPLDMIGFLEEEAGKDNLSLKITPFPLVKDEENDFDFVAFRLTISGQFPGLLRFIKRVENSQRLVELEDLVISKKKREEIIEVSSVIKVYAQEKEEK